MPIGEKYNRINTNIVRIMYEFILSDFTSSFILLLLLVVSYVRPLIFLISGGNVNILTEISITIQTKKEKIAKYKKFRSAILYHIPSTIKLDLLISSHIH